MQITLKSDTHDLIKHLHSLPWLANVGKCISVDVKTVGSLSNAKSHMHKRKFMSLLTEFINNDQFVRCSDPHYANMRAAEADLVADLVCRESEGMVDFLMNRHPLLVEIEARSIISTHILGFITEVNFNQNPDEAPFLKYILPWYEKGHLPCGWDGKLSGVRVNYDNWVLPEGRLIVW